MRLLFVENHALFAATVRARFLAEHDVTVVPSVAEARRVMDERAFDVVLVDYDLEDGKGTELIRALREQGSRIPVVAVSAKDEGNARLRAAGADAVCGKMEFARIAAVLAMLAPASA